jgi:colicin import membrane protein
VAGEGTNFGATEAPALGTPGGVKLSLPEPTPPEPEPAQPAAPPVPPPAAPVAPPKAEAPPRPAAPPQNFAKQILRKLYNADAKAKREVAKERAEEQKRITKEEFDRANQARSAEKTASAKVKRIDSEGIAKGVAGGSTANKVGGSSGRALTSTDGSARERYDAALLAALPARPRGGKAARAERVPRRHRGVSCRGRRPALQHPHHQAVRQQGVRQRGQGHDPARRLDRAETGPPRR